MKIAPEIFSTDVDEAFIRDTTKWKDFQNDALMPSIWVILQSPTLVDQNKPEIYTNMFFLHFSEMLGVNRPRKTPFVFK